MEIMTTEKNPAAVALGRLAKGKAKTVSPASIRARRRNAKLGGRPKQTPIAPAISGK